jgi:hypothetical protein
MNIAFLHNNEVVLTKTHTEIHYYSRVPQEEHTQAVLDRRARLEKHGDQITLIYPGLPPELFNIGTDPGVVAYWSVFKRIPVQMVQDQDPVIFESDLCPITCAPISTAGVTSCGHVFERDAILSWLSTRNTCPVCRRQSIDIQ